MKIVIIGAGAVVKENEQVPPRSMVVGVPGKIVRQVTDEELELIRERAEEYVQKVALYFEADDASDPDRSRA